MTALRVRGVPERIVCLTEEPTEILYALGEQDRIVGISAYTVRPKAAREKPVVSAFIGGSVPKIAALKPDLIIGFSDIQAQLAHDLIKANLPVLIFNQRSVQEILDVVVQVGSLVDRRVEAVQLAQGYLARIAAARSRAAQRGHRPRVYFEEWDEPRISAIQWVSELIGIVGGDDIFADRASGKLAKDRFVQDSEVIARQPELIVGCWCGKPVDIPSLVGRPGYASLPAVQRGAVVELAPEIILQPGPAALTDGLDALEALVTRASMR